VSATSDSRVATHDIARLFRRHHRDLERAVTAAVRAPREVIEDACQNAWAIMLRSPPRGPTWFPWLRVVAIHEAYRLCETHFVTHLEDLGHNGGWETLLAGRVTIDDAIEARRALRRLAELPSRQREDLSLRVAGFTYAEIQEISGGRSYSNVDKHLKKARARIRLAELLDAGAKSQREASL
jgi:DNA-directed RNA polymerase specialized sigma24 family protein